MKNNAIIVGCGIHSIYIGIGLLDMGFDVTILEKKTQIIPEKFIHNCKIYNNNHRTYIKLLKKFNIRYEILDEHKIDLTFFKFMDKIVNKIKILPSNILSSNSFFNICKQILNDSELSFVSEYNKKLDGFFEMINAFDCVNIFQTDFTHFVKYYYLNSSSITELFTKMKNLFIEKNGKIIYNNEVSNVKQCKKKILVFTTCNNVYSCNTLFVTVSKENLSKFEFLNNDQKKVMNMISLIDISILNNFFGGILNSNTNNDMYNTILNDLHIVFPTKINQYSNHIYIWNKENNLMIREKLKYQFNQKFYICSECFSYNNMFINYSLEHIDNILENIIM